jgi:hypothetical protein
VENAIKILFGVEGTCSIDTDNKIYESWPEYCKTHKFLSSINHILPDVILPAINKDIVYMTDAYFDLKSGN